MGGSFFILAIIALTVVAPVWIVFHYATRWRLAKNLTGEDEKLLTDLWRLAEKTEARIKTLERILDADTPDWRDRP